MRKSFQMKTNMFQCNQQNEILQTFSDQKVSMEKSQSMAN